LLHKGANAGTSRQQQQQGNNKADIADISAAEAAAEGGLLLLLCKVLMQARPGSSSSRAKTQLQCVKIQLQRILVEMGGLICFNRCKQCQTATAEEKGDIDSW
jgi:hypothetical protein